MMKRTPGRPRRIAGAKEGEDQPAELGFESLADVDQVAVTTHMNAPIGEITDPADIAALIHFIREQRAGWTVPEWGVPIARLRLTFFAGGSPRGNFEVERGYFTAHQYGGFWYRPASEDQVRSLLALIGMENLWHEFLTADG